MKSINSLFYFFKTIIISKFLTFFKISYNEIENFQTIYFEMININFPNNFSFNWLENIKNLKIFLIQNSNNLNIKNLPNHIQTLNFINCSLKNIEENWFFKKIHLKYLNLSFNKIIEIEKDIFIGLKSLKILDLSFNPLKLIFSNTFEYLNKLEYLALQSIDHLKFLNQIESFNLKKSKTLKYVSFDDKYFCCFLNSAQKCNWLIYNGNSCSNLFSNTLIYNFFMLFCIFQIILLFFNFFAQFYLRKLKILLKKEMINILSDMILCSYLIIISSIQNVKDFHIFNLRWMSGFSCKFIFFIISFLVIFLILSDTTFVFFMVILKKLNKSFESRNLILIIFSSIVSSCLMVSSFLFFDLNELLRWNSFCHPFTIENNVFQYYFTSLLLILKILKFIFFFKSSKPYNENYDKILELIKCSVSFGILLFHIILTIFPKIIKKKRNESIIFFLWIPFQFLLLRFSQKLSIKKIMAERKERFANQRFKIFRLFILP